MNAIPQSYNVAPDSIGQALIQGGITIRNYTVMDIDIVHAIGQTQQLSSLETITLANTSIVSLRVHGYDCLTNQNWVINAYAGGLDDYPYTTGSIDEVQTGGVWRGFSLSHQAINHDANGNAVGTPFTVDVPFTWHNAIYNPTQNGHHTTENGDGDGNDGGEGNGFHDNGGHANGGVGGGGIAGDGGNDGH